MCDRQVHGDPICSTLWSANNQVSLLTVERDKLLLQVDELKKKYDLVTVGGILDVRDCPKCGQKWPEFGCSSFMTCYRCRHKAELEESNRLIREKDELAQAFETRVNTMTGMLAEATEIMERCRDIVDDDLENRPARHSLGRLFANLKHWLQSSSIKRKDETRWCTCVPEKDGTHQPDCVGEERR